MRTVLAMTAALAMAFCACEPQPSSQTAAVIGEKAMEHVIAQVGFGPRPAGSPQLQKCREYIEQQMRNYGYLVEDDAFVAQTPYGPIEMHNLIARRGTANREAIVLASHYDTKLIEGKNFVGANDAGSSTGLLIELARVLAASRDPVDYWFLFLDGEEAFVQWSTFDSTYGSRHLAKRWKEEGVVPRIRALILLDMIGDKDLDIFFETHSTERLMNLVHDTAIEIGLKSILSTYRTPVEDDHLPFLDAGIPSVDIIDLNFGPQNSYHHTLEDTLDKVSPQSMEKVGKLVLAVLAKLQDQ